MSETDIIKKLQQGDERAFRVMVEKYQKLVVNACYKMVFNQEDAKDIAQEVFIEVFHSIHKFRGESKFSTWLYRISINRSLNFIRDNKNQKKTQAIEQDNFGRQAKKEADLGVYGDEADKAVESQERQKMLHKTISSLPESQRVAFTLNKYEDLSYQQIAEVMETSVSAVESLIHRAKKNLQKKLYTCYKKKCI